MADAEMTSGATALASAAHIPIAQLTPLLAAPSTRSVKAIVTLTWPYSSATGSVAFLLAEPDFRLRRTRGQVRVQFSGSSAKAVAKSGIASGDEIILSLEGVEWVQDETPFATPGKGVEFDLKFTERLLLQFRQEDSEEASHIDIDHPTPEPEAPAESRIPSPEADPSPYATANSSGFLARPGPLIRNGDEWSSPAFIKRARTSYGSLFDNEYDPFAEEDGTVRGKGRKRTRLSSTWRYESRSPSPEVERENTLDTSPEPEVQQKSIMTDEGCQTVGLEDGDAAEVLADFHKQVTNVGSSSYLQTNGTVALEARSQPQGETDSGIYEKPADLPMIQTQLDADIAKLPEQGSQNESSSQKIPSSPRLQPISSDTLPLVSPLITSKFGAFLGMGPMQGFGEVPIIREQVPTLVDEPMLQVADSEQEDLYGASPAAFHGPVSTDDLNGFLNSSVGIDALEAASNMESQLLSEDQYGHWQSATAQLSRGGSPHKVVEETRDEEQQDGFYVKDHRQEHGFQNNGFPGPGVDDQHLHQYPQPEEENHDQTLSASWEGRPGETAYPDLPDPDEELNNDRVAQQALQPRAIAMSRSGSAQSATVDLTESSDEEEAEEEDEMHIPLEGPIDQEVYERSDVSEEGFAVEENQAIRGHMDGYRSLGDESSEDDEKASVDGGRAPERHLHNGPHSDDGEASQNSQDEEGPYEEDVYEDELGDHNEQYRGYPPGFDPEQEKDFDEEEDEGSYDEDMEEDEDEQPRVQRAPVVIDLLSSDDEDGAEPAAPKFESQPARPTRVAKATSPHSSDEKRHESDDDMDSEDDMNVEQDLLPQSQAHSSRAAVEQEFEQEDDDEHFVPGTEDKFIAAEPDDELHNSENEVSMEDAASEDGDYAKGPDEFDQDTEMVHPDEAVVDEKPGGPPDGGEAAIQEIEAETLEEEPLHAEPALQKVEEVSQTTKSAEKDTDSVRSNVGMLPKQSSGCVPAPAPSLFAQMFNLDGANDERLPSLYPILPKEEDANPTTEASPEETSQNAVSVEDQLVRQANNQLPTPADTQISLVKESSEMSVASVAGQEIPSEPLQSTSNELPNDPALEPAPQPMQLDTIASADDIKINAETETNGTQAIYEETAKISLEESNIEKAEDEKTAKVVTEAHNTRSRTRQQNGSLEPVVQEEVRSVEEVIRSSPRRSHRRGKSSSSTTEAPQTKLPSTPSQSAAKTRQDGPVSARSDRSSSMVLDERTTPKGHDASIELAMSALDSPVKQQHDLRSNQPDMNRKLKLTRALRTELSEFTALKVLRFHNAEKLDVLGVVTTVPPEPERAKNGPRHYQITFNITDQSVVPGASSPVTEVHVFRPFKDALPIVNIGDGILLRNFQVISVKNRGFALQSTDTSSWAVFKGEEEADAEIRGPPVEFGAGEKKQISMLRAWYTELDTTAKDKINKANGDKGMAGVGKGIGKAF